MDLFFSTRLEVLRYDAIQKCSYFVCSADDDKVVASS